MKNKIKIILTILLVIFIFVLGFNLKSQILKVILIVVVILALFIVLLNIMSVKILKKNITDENKAVLKLINAEKNNIFKIKKINGVRINTEYEELPEGEYEIDLFFKGNEKIRFLQKKFFLKKGKILEINVDKELDKYVLKTEYKNIGGEELI